MIKKIIQSLIKSRLFKKLFAKSEAALNLFSRIKKIDFEYLQGHKSILSNKYFCEKSSK